MVAKDTFFYVKKTLNCRGEILDLSSPKVMGILNVSPDSFYDGGQYSSDKEIILRAHKILEEGASIIDIGACSTRPGAAAVSAGEEAGRLLPVLKLLKKEFPGSILSVDTYRAEIAEQAVEAGAAIVNDISGGAFDPVMFKTIGRMQVPYICMHIQGTPKNMQEKPHYSNVVEDLMAFFLNKIPEMKSTGMKDIILDPGFGFGKSVEHNYQLLNSLSDFRIFECPVLAGVSRKSMINKVLNTTPDKALNGTTVLNTIALLNGASILRVHDVKQAVEAVKLVFQFEDLKI